MTDMQQQQLAAKDDEIRDLVTSDNKVIVDLSKHRRCREDQAQDTNAVDLKKDQKPVDIV